MKILIWCVTMFLVAVIQTVLRINGVLLGAIPTALLYGGACALAKALCNALDGGSKAEPKNQLGGTEIVQDGGSTPDTVSYDDGKSGNQGWNHQADGGQGGVNTVLDGQKTGGADTVLENNGQGGVATVIDFDDAQGTANAGTGQTTRESTGVNRTPKIPPVKCDHTEQQQRQWLETLNSVIPTIRLGGGAACVDYVLQPQVMEQLGGIEPAVKQVAWRISRMLSITNLEKAITTRDYRQLQEACMVLQQYEDLLTEADVEPVRRALSYLKNLMLDTYDGGQH